MFDFSIFSLNRCPGQFDHNVHCNVRISVHIGKSRFPVDWRLLVKECIGNIGISLNRFAVSMIIFVYIFCLFGLANQPTVPPSMSIFRFVLTRQRGGFGIFWPFCMSEWTCILGQIFIGFILVLLFFCSDFQYELDLFLLLFLRLYMCNIIHSI